MALILKINKGSSNKPRLNTVSLNFGAPAREEEQLLVVSPLVSVSAFGSSIGFPLPSTTCIITTEALFELLGSSSFAVTVAVLTTDPVPFGITTMSIMTIIPSPMSGRLPRLHVTIPYNSAQVPWLELAETKVTPAGRMSNKVTPVASRGPRFPILIV
jgi:hypothetical protein